MILKVLMVDYNTTTDNILTFGSEEVSGWSENIAGVNKADINKITGV